MEVKVRKNVLAKYKIIVMDLGKSIVLGTPVDTGQARGNWRFTNARPSVAYNPRNLDPTGAKAIGRLSGVVAALKITSPVYMTNNVPYIDRLEHGWSKQAPAGMLSRNIARVRSKYKVL